jgi:hypothetical protein
MMLPTSFLPLRRAAALLCVPSLLAAQTAVREAAREAPRDTAGVPKGMIPPAGMCRVWVQNVPAAQQPAPTDCVTALRQKAANAKVVWGPRTLDQRTTRLNAERAKPKADVADRPLTTPPRTANPTVRPSQAKPPSAAPTRVPATAAVRTPPAAPPAATPRSDPPKKPERP